MTPAAAPCPTADRVAINMSGVTVELGGSTVLDRVDLTLRQGEWLGLIGPNGAGKTSLLRAVVDLVDHQGKIETAEGVRPGPRDIALVPQIPTVPVGMTVAEYALIGRTAHLGWLARESDADRQIVASVLRRLDLGELVDRDLSALSGGELQRAVIARALVQEAPALLLDEPTSALDIGHQRSVLELVDDLRRADGLSVLAVMHDLTTAASFADRLAVLDRGRVIAVGPPAEVLDAQLLSEVFGSPLTVQMVDGQLVVLPAPRPARGQRP